MEDSDWEGATKIEAQVMTNTTMTKEDVKNLVVEKGRAVSSSSCLDENNDDDVMLLLDSNKEQEKQQQQQPSLIFVGQSQRHSTDDGRKVQVLPLDEQQQQQQEPPEILVAYLSGEPEAVAAIELLREAQRIWDQRKRTSITLSSVSSISVGQIQQQQQQESHYSPSIMDDHVVEMQSTSNGQTTSTANNTRRYSHEDLRIAYTNISAQLVATERMMEQAAVECHPPAPLLPLIKSPALQQQQQQQKKLQQHYRRRASAQAESLTGQAVARYQHKQQQQQQPNKKNSISGPSASIVSSGRNNNNKRINGTPRGSAAGQQQLELESLPQRPRSSRGSVDAVSQAMNTAGMAVAAASSSSSRRNSSLTDSAYLKVMMADGGRRPSNHRLITGAAIDADTLLPLGSDAVSFHREQRRRASSSKASAIFLLSPTGKEGGGQLVPEPEDEDDNSPEGRRRRRTISVIATVGAFLLVLSILMVTVTLRLATHIDDLGKDIFFYRAKSFTCCPRISRIKYSIEKIFELI